MRRTWVISVAALAIGCGILLVPEEAPRALRVLHALCLAAGFGGGLWLLWRYSFSGLKERDSSIISR